MKCNLIVAATILASACVFGAPGSVEAQSQGYYYAPQSYYVVPPTYHVAGFSPYAAPAGIIVQEPYLVPGPFPEVLAPLPAIGYAPYSYREKLKSRRPGKLDYDYRVYEPGRLAPVYRYEYEFNRGRVKVKERFR